MHAGRNWDDVTGESGPEDPDLSVISFQGESGRPIAVLANFSMHYFGGQDGLSADYFGLFCDRLGQQIGGRNDQDGRPFVAIMSHGCSGDIWRRDYTQRDYSKPTDKADNDLTIQTFTDGLVQICLKALKSVTYRDDAQLKMLEARLKMRYRVPDKQRLHWSEQVVRETGDRPPNSTREVYAREQIMLNQMQNTEVVIQAVRIGSIGIVTTPTETYALTGLKLKLQSPLAHNMVIELANGGDGYIPPPEQHALGGYNTWPARSAGLEMSAEPRITEAALSLLEQTTEQPRRHFTQSRGPACEAALQARPVAFWRMDDFAAPRAKDVSGQGNDAIYESGVVFFLEGPRSDLFCRHQETNRAAHFAGGRLRARLPELDRDHYSVSAWFWNGMPADVRPTTGWIYSRGRDRSLVPAGDHVGVGGTSTEPGKLILLRCSAGDQRTLAVGRRPIPRWSWNHVVMVSEGSNVRLYLNGDSAAGN